MKAFLVALSLTLSTSTVCLADAFEEKAIEVLRLSNSIEPSLDVMDQMMKSMKPILFRQLIPQIGKNGITESDVNDLIDEFGDRFIARFQERLIPLTVDEMRKHVTLQELEELAELMRHPAYQRYAAKLPDIMKSMMHTSQQEGRVLGGAVMMELLEEYPKFK